MEETITQVLRYVVPALCIIIIVYCIKHLLSNKAPKVEPACLIDDLTGNEYNITNWETSVGRSNACDIVLNYATVSRFHAVIAKHKKGWVITDTNSSAGTYIGQKKVDGSAIVNDGDNVSFGGIVLQFKVK